MPQKLLEGEVMESPADQETERLRETNRTLMRELNSALEENESLRKRVAIADAPIARLREKLAPFYQLLQAIFGDIEELGPESENRGGASSASHVQSPAWESWKQKLPGTPALVITALQTHSDANTKQLMVLCKRGKDSIHQAIYKLNQAGLINKNGGRFSLKQL